MWLKRFTVQNIVIGGLAGALPPVIAATSITGTITIQSLILCSIIFFWTPPHFWALALVKKQDYANVNIPMLPNIKGDKRTIIEILVYGFILFMITFVPVFMGFADIIYSVFAVVFGLYYYVSCVKIYFAYDTVHFHKTAMQSFFISIFYLFGLFLSLLFENIIGVQFL
jgi:protoheme IX farnesyltransferase